MEIDKHYGSGLSTQKNRLLSIYQDNSEFSFGTTLFFPNQPKYQNIKPINIQNYESHYAKYYGQESPLKKFT